jgi:anti-sigma factor RsiW
MTPQDDVEMDASMQAELDLLAYLDGELEGDRAAAVIARLQTDRAYAARLKALEAVSDFLRKDADRIYRSARVDSIVDDVMTKVSNPPLAEVIPMSQVAPPTSRLTRQKKSTVIWVAFGGVAAAAAALIFYMGRDHGGPGPAPVASATTAPSAPRATADTVAVKTPNPPPSNPPVPETASTVEVENLEVGSGATVIYTRGEEGSSPVVWITAREAK